MRSSDGSDRQETLALYDEWEAVKDLADVLAT